MPIFGDADGVRLGFTSDASSAGERDGFSSDAKLDEANDERRRVEITIAAVIPMLDRVATSLLLLTITPTQWFQVAYS